jgi:hypothetical protein
MEYYHQRVPHEKAAHVLTYEDRDGDWMMVGDVPWEYVSPPPLQSLFTCAFHLQETEDLFWQAIPWKCEETEDLQEQINAS